MKNLYEIYKDETPAHTLKNVKGQTIELFEPVSGSEGHTVKMMNREKKQCYASTFFEFEDMLHSIDYQPIFKKNEMILTADDINFWSFLYELVNEVRYGNNGYVFSYNSYKEYSKNILNVAPKSLIEFKAEAKNFNKKYNKVLK